MQLERVSDLHIDAEDITYNLCCSLLVLGYNWGKYSDNHSRVNFPFHLLFAIVLLIILGRPFRLNRRLFFSKLCKFILSSGMFILRFVKLWLFLNFPYSITTTPSYQDIDQIISIPLSQRLAETYSYRSYYGPNQSSFEVQS